MQSQTSAEAEAEGLLPLASAQEDLNNENQVTKEGLPLGETESRRGDLVFALVSVVREDRDPRGLFSPSLHLSYKYRIARFVQ
jgi:hypothetical protein